MAIKLEVRYPGKTVVDANNQFGTFKNRTDDILKDGTPYERGWVSDVWGFLAHILKKAVVVPNDAEENETNSQYYDALEGLIGRKAVKFESEDLIINVQSNTTVDADAKRLSLLDSNNIPKYINDLDITFTMPTNLEAGTAEKASHWYQMWVDSDLNRRLVPDLTGSTDSTVAGFLADSTATLLTDLVHAGDIVYNLTDLTQTTVSVDAIVEGQVALTDDIFTSGEDYKIVKMSPEGLGANRARIGAAYNNSGSNFDNSIYTQVQEEKTYLGDGTNFTVTGSGTGWVTEKAVAVPYQTSDGTWRLRFNIKGNRSSSASSLTLTLSGVTFAANDQVCTVKQATLILTSAFADALTANISITSSATGDATVSGDVELESKPTFHN